MELSKLYLSSHTHSSKAIMTETEEFARWLAELVVTAITDLSDGKLSFNEYPDFAKALWGAKDAFVGISKFVGEVKQATIEDWIHLKDSVKDELMKSVVGTRIPIDYIDLLSDTAVQNVKFFNATKELLVK